MATQSTEKIKVFARIRPSKEEQVHKVVHIENNNVILRLNGESKPFQFDGLFGEDSTQEDVFDGTASRIVHGALQGYNGTIFAYGQTGSGKTHTMIGPSNKFDEHSGIIPRGLHMLFEQLDQKREELPGTFTAKITVSFVEIYNENIYDLFTMNDEKLKIGQDPEGNAMVKGVTEIFVKDLNDAMEEVRRGWNNRTVGSTAMNRHSSRSHALLLIKILTEEVHGGESSDRISTARSAFLNLVDLAGSERVSQSKVVGEQLKETANINKSLFQLKRVIRELSEQKFGHIPFRSSVLTHILKDSLGGNARTAVMINVHPDKMYYSETLSTLQFSAEVRRIENKVVVNENLKGESVNAYKAEIRRLQNEMEKMQQKCAEEVAETNKSLDAWKEAANKMERQFLLDVDEENVQQPIVIQQTDSFEEKELKLELEVNTQKQIIDEKIQECDRLRSTLEKAEERASVVEETLKTALSTSEDKSRRRRRRNKELTADIEKAKKTIGEENEKFVVLEKRSNELEGQLMEANGQMERLQSDMDLMRSTHLDEMKELETSLKSNLSDKEKKEVDLNRELEAVKSQLESKRIELLNKETEKKAGDEVLSMLRDSIIKGEQEKSLKMEELESITCQMEELKEAAEIERKKMNDRLKEYEEARKNSEEVHRGKIEGLEKEIETKRKELERESEKVQQLGESSSAQLTRLQEDMDNLRIAKDAEIAQKIADAQHWSTVSHQFATKMEEIKAELGSEKEKRDSAERSEKRAHDILRLHANQNDELKENISALGSHNNTKQKQHMLSRYVEDKRVLTLRVTQLEAAMEKHGLSIPKSDHDSPRDSLANEGDGGTENNAPSTSTSTAAAQPSRRATRATVAAPSTAASSTTSVRSSRTTTGGATSKK